MLEEPSLRSEIRCLEIVPGAYLLASVSHELRTGLLRCFALCHVPRRSKFELKPGSDGNWADLRRSGERLAPESAPEAEIAELASGWVRRGGKWLEE